MESLLVGQHHLPTAQRWRYERATEGSLERIEDPVAGELRFEAGSRSQGYRLSSVAIDGSSTHQTVAHGIRPAKHVLKA